MYNRRHFLQSLGVVGALGAVDLKVNASTSPETDPRPDSGAGDRIYWLSVMDRLARPVLTALVHHDLKRTMPVEAAHPADRARFTHLEALGRLLAGIAPWLEAGNLAPAESAVQKDFRALTLAALDAATDPASPDFLNFGHGDQALVDTAFLAQGLLRAPTTLLSSLDPRIRRQLIAALKSSRAIPTPRHNNWVLFAALVETALLSLGESTLEERLEGCLRHMLNWYAGDGAYGDGDFFHFDYYNSFVIHPMLVDACTVLARSDPRYNPVRELTRRRAERYAVIQERLIAPDGTFPSIGRSTTYRFGAFQTLAQMALLHALPGSLSPAQVRCGLTAVIRRMTEAPGTFDSRGWLQIGFCGHQPALAESYISTGSLYLASAGLLPLGLPPSDPFWAAPPARWTSQKIWSGEALPADHALADVRSFELPTLPARSFPAGTP